MKRVKVLQPFGGYEVGDTPTLIGSQARDLRERGMVEWEQDAPVPAPVVPTAPAKPAKRVRAPKAAPAKAAPAKRRK